MVNIRQFSLQLFMVSLSFISVPRLSPSWSDCVQEYEHTAVVSLEKESLHRNVSSDFFMFSLIFTAIASRALYDLVRKEQTVLVVSREGVRFNSDTNTILWEDVRSLNRIVDNFFLSSSKGKVFVEINGTEVCLTDSTLFYEELLQLISYYRKDSTHTGFKMVKKLERPTVRVMKNEAHIRLRRLPAWLALVVGIPALVMNYYIYRSICKAFYPEKLMSVEHDGVVLLCKGGEKVPFEDDIYEQFKESASTLMIHDGEKCYDVSVSSGFNYEKFVKLIEKVRNKQPRG